MKKNFKYFVLSLLAALGMPSCTDIVDNPVSGLTNPESLEQQIFWTQFDAWKTDSCEAGDDFFMHMLGTWWKNPVDIYPDGLLPYAAYLNYQRVDDIFYTNANLQHLLVNALQAPIMNEEETGQMINAKVEELWAGATTREEALAALGRAWAEGYYYQFGPSVVLVEGVPTWQLKIKIPEYINYNSIGKCMEKIWEATAPRHNARMTGRRASAADDLAIIAKAMNVEHLEVADNLAEGLAHYLENNLSTVEAIRGYIDSMVSLADGVLVNDECLANYNKVLPILLAGVGFPEVTLTRKDIKYHVYVYMGNLYALNDYNTQYISQSARQQYADWCEKFREVMRKRLEDNTWLEDATRQNALKKLDKIVFYIGGISVIPDCVIPTLTGENLVADVRQLRKARMDGYRWAFTQQRSACAILLDDLEYLQDRTIDNAFYSPSLNCAIINPSNLLPPYVQDDYEDAFQWAFIATTIGHELTHGFDTDGAQYDQWGHRKNWWTEADAAKFQTLCNQLAEQYNQLQLMPWEDPTLYGDGVKTLSENIADLGGCCLGLQILLEQYSNASDAMKKALARRYFQAWAIQWSTSYTLDYVQWMKTKDEHSLSRERTNGVVRNVDAWYDAYDITSGTLYLEPSSRVRIW